MYSCLTNEVYRSREAEGQGIMPSIELLESKCIYDRLAERRSILTFYGGSEKKQNELNSSCQKKY